MAKFERNPSRSFPQKRKTNSQISAARLSATEAADYNAVKVALLKGYNKTENGCELKFRDSKPEANESTTQFITRRIQNIPVEARSI